MQSRSIWIKTAEKSEAPAYAGVKWDRMGWDVHSSLDGCLKNLLHLALLKTNFESWLTLSFASKAVYVADI